MSESKIVYLDNGNERCLRGMITEEDDFFITLKRRDREIRIAKKVIVRIESARGDDFEE